MEREVPLQPLDPGLCCLPEHFLLSSVAQLVAIRVDLWKLELEEGSLDSTLCLLLDVLPELCRALVDLY